MGTGPFSLEDYDNLVLKKNPDYWKKDEDGNQLPYLDEIKIEPIPDSKVRLQSLRSGDIDIFQTADTDNIVDVVKGGDDFKVQKVTGTSSTIVLFNLSKPPFDDIRMRQAYAYALNRNEINRVQYQGSRQESYSAFNPDSPFYAEDVEPAARTTCRRPRTSSPSSRPTASRSTSTPSASRPTSPAGVLGLVQDQMKKAGMTQTNEFKDQGSYVNRIFSKSGDYQVGCFRSPRPPAPTGSTTRSSPTGPATSCSIRTPRSTRPSTPSGPPPTRTSRPSCSRRCRSEAAKDLPVLQLLFDLFGNIHTDKVSGLPAPEPWSLGAIKVAGLYLEK